MPFVYELSYAGVPLLLDQAVAFRMHQPVQEQETGDQHAPRKHQPMEGIVEELDRMLPFLYLQDFSVPGSFAGRNQSALATTTEDGQFPNTKVRIGDWYYPTGARRWSTFRGLATSSQVKRMLEASQEALLSGSSLLPFVMRAVPQGAVSGTESAYSITSPMTMLPPRPLAEHGSKFDGLYLITLVDERFNFRGTPVLMRPQLGTTWADLLNSLGEALGITITSQSPIEAVYGTPELDSQLWSAWESAPVLLDAVVSNVGRSLVRNLDGTYTLLTTAESTTIVNSNRGTIQSLLRTAGGNMFSSGESFFGGSLSYAKNLVVPRSVVVAYPKYVVGNDPVPHFVNPRYQNQRRSCWYEDGYGDNYLLEVPITSGGPFVSGMVGEGIITLYNTAKALLSGEVAINSGVLLNASGLTALSVQIAKDYYAGMVSTGLDEAYAGIYAWEPEGINDVVWSFSHQARGAVTRVIHPPWTLYSDEFQHATPALSGYTPVPPGVGGQSVAQSIRDSVGISGTFIGTSGVMLSGVWVSGSVSTILTQSLSSGGHVAEFQGVSHFPTQNRWYGQINGEQILFNGTSGGISGNLVTIAQRGTNGTIQIDQGNNSLVKQVFPNTTYGVNLVTYEKGQFTYPQEITSGGIQGVNVVPQMQTVQVLDGDGVALSGITHYSGVVQVYDATTPPSSGPWVSAELVWVVERNDEVVLQSGTRYGGQLLGTSIRVADMAQAAPIYGVNVGGDEFESNELLVQLSAKSYADETCPQYQGFRVVDTATGCTYVEPDPIPGGNCLTIFHEQGTDLVVYPPPSPRAGVPLLASNDDDAGDAEWTTPIEELVEDQPPGSCTIDPMEESQYLKVTGLCLNIPEEVEGVSVTVSSITVRVTAKATGESVSDCDVRLVVSDAVTGNSRSTGTELDTTYSTDSFTGTASQWGTGTSPATYNTDDFGCAIRYVNGSGVARTVDVSRIQVEVAFSPAGQITQWCVVRIRQGDSGNWLTDHDPRVELPLDDTESDDVVIGGVTYRPAFYTRYNQDTKELETVSDALIRILT